MDGFEVIRLFIGFCGRVLAWMCGLEMRLPVCFCGREQALVVWI